MRQLVISRIEEILEENPDFTIKLYSPLSECDDEALLTIFETIQASAIIKTCVLQKDEDQEIADNKFIISNHKIEPILTIKSNGSTEVN